METDISSLFPKTDEELLQKLIDKTPSQEEKEKYQKEKKEKEKNS